MRNMVMWELHLSSYMRTQRKTGKRVENYSKEHLAKFQVPKYFFYLKNGDWPRTSTGKVQKFRLKEMAGKLTETIK